MEYPKDRRYTKDHEWLKDDGGRFTVGITAHAAKELGDIVFVELPTTGSEVAAGAIVATVESVKAVGDVLAPLSGKVVAANTDLESAPQSVNEDPHGRGWILVIEATDPSEAEHALSAEAYEQLLATS